MDLVGLSGARSSVPCRVLFCVGVLGVRPVLGPAWCVLVTYVALDGLMFRACVSGSTEQAQAWRRCNSAACGTGPLAGPRQTRLCGFVKAWLVVVSCIMRPLVRVLAWSLCVVGSLELQLGRRHDEDVAAGVGTWQHAACNPCSPFGRSDGEVLGHLENTRLREVLDACLLAGLPCPSWLALCPNTIKQTPNVP